MRERVRVSRRIRDAEPARSDRPTTGSRPPRSARRCSSGGRCHATRRRTTGSGLLGASAPCATGARKPPRGQVPAIDRRVGHAMMSKMAEGVPMSQDAFLSKVPLFSNCSPTEIAAIAAVAQERTYAAGQIIVTQGTPGQAFCMVLSGRAEILRDSSSLGAFGAGDFFGEMSLLDQAPRSATIRGGRDDVPDAAQLGLQAAPRAAPVDRGEAPGGSEPPAADRRRASHALADTRRSDPAHRRERGGIR